MVLGKSVTKLAVTTMEKKGSDLQLFLEVINYTCIEFHTVNHFLPIFFLQTKPVLCTVVSAEMIIHSLSLSFKHI